MGGIDSVRSVVISMVIHVVKTIIISKIEKMTLVNILIFPGDYLCSGFSLKYIRSTFTIGIYLNCNLGINP